MRRQGPTRYKVGAVIAIRVSSLRDKVDFDEGGIPCTWDGVAIRESALVTQVPLFAKKEVGEICDSQSCPPLLEGARGSDVAIPSIMAITDRRYFLLST